MDDEKTLKEKEADEVPAAVENTEGAPERPTRGLEGFYENFRDVPLRYLDIFITICVVVLVAVIAFGIYQARS